MRPRTLSVRNPGVEKHYESRKESQTLAFNKKERQTEGRESHDAGSPAKVTNRDLSKTSEVERKVTRYPQTGSSGARTDEERASLALKGVPSGAHQACDIL